jgi:CDP-2,3-bis-(O-geranylgeranyl)-sn-glycerol synthase
MVDEFLRMSYLFVPMVGGAICHGLSMRYNWLAFLAKPLDFYRTFRGRRVFGDNKTFRGVIVFGLGTALVFAWQAMILHERPAFRALEIFDYRAAAPWLFGFALGVAAMLSELPNSFIKRQLGVASGAAATGIKLPIFYLVDQLDLLVGTWFLLSLVTQVTLARVIISAVIVLVMHQLINIFGYYLGMRKTLR